MYNIRGKRKRSKALVLMLLPALIFIGVAGWLISCFEPPHRKTQKSYHKALTSQRDDGVSFIPAIYQETEEINN